MKSPGVSGVSNSFGHTVEAIGRDSNISAVKEFDRTLVIVHPKGERQFMILKGKLSKCCVISGVCMLIVLDGEVQGG